METMKIVTTDELECWHCEEVTEHECIQQIEEKEDNGVPYQDTVLYLETCTKCKAWRSQDENENWDSGIGS